jgi:ATP-dependent DNA helicase RecG
MVRGGGWSTEQGMMHREDSPGMKEDQQVEWKSSWRDDYLRWICGFANAEGGVLVIGRDDRGVAVGVEDASRLMEEIPNKVRDLLGIMVEVNLRRVKGRELVEIGIDPYPNPISYKGEYYYRSGSTNQMLKGAALDRFLLRRHGRTWDGVPLPGVSLADLDAEALREFRRLAGKSQRLPEAVLDEPDQNLLEKLHLVEGSYLTRAAALLFYPEPERFFTGASVKIGYFESNVDLRYQDEVQGNLIYQVNQTIEILKAKYLRAWISYEGLQRIETWPVPLPALREAVLNAVVHRDYASGAPIQISVYPDKLMIWNPGELPPDWTVEKLLGKHASIPFNPDIAGVFFRAGMIEAWGRGIERIMISCRETGTPEPEMRYEQTGLWVVFPYLPEHTIPAGPATSEVIVEAIGTSTAKTPVELVGTPVETVETPVERAKTPVKMPVKAAEMPAKTPDKIVELLRANPHMTLAEVAEAIGKSRRAVERATAKLVDARRLRYVGPRKTGHWEVLR